MVGAYYEQQNESPRFNNETNKNDPHNNALKNAVL